MIKRLNAVCELTVRNLKCFFREKSLVFFSFLTPMILLFLYVFFLGGMQKDGVAETLKGIEGLVFTQSDVNSLVDSWLIANMLSVSVLTVTLGAAGIIVADRAAGIDVDFNSSPVRSYKVTLAWFISVFIIGLILNLALFAAFEIYYLASGGSFMGAARFFQFLGVLLLTLGSTTFFVTFIVSFFKSLNGYSGLTAFISAFSGFIIGAYVPINTFSPWLQGVSNVLPNSHASALLRNIFMSDKIENLLGGNAEAVQSFRDSFALDLYMGGAEIDAWVSFAVLAASLVLFFALSCLRFRKKK